MKRAVVWIVDDEPAICWSLRKGLESRDCDTRVFSNAEDAVLAAQSGSECDVLITDIRLPKQDGFSLLSYFSADRNQVPVIMMTAFGDLETAVKATKYSVFEYLVKPFDLKEALNAVDKAIEHRGQKSRAANFSLSITEALLLGQSKEIQKLYRDIAIASKSEHPVLILGIEGTPTEAVASAIHRNSVRNTHPFLSVLPTTFSVSNLEREFVGIAQRDQPGEQPGDSLKTGLLGLVGCGTLFIEEISDLPSNVQSQLLRVLEQNNFFPLGGSRSLAFHGRVVASSTRSLEEFVASGELDSGLLQRLKVQQLEVPPLDSRREDAPLIAKALASRVRSQMVELSQDAEEWLANKHWPGDVRQLRNCVEHAVALLPGSVLNAEDLAQAYDAIGERIQSGKTQFQKHHEKIAGVIRNWLQESLIDSADQTDAPEFGMLYDDFLALVEPPLLTQLLEHLQYNRAATAAKLGMHRSTLRQKMKKYDID